MARGSGTRQGRGNFNLFFKGEMNTLEKSFVDLHSEGFDLDKEK
jgi:hypothetical protein